MKFTEKAILTAQTQVALQNPAGRFFVYLLHFNEPLLQKKGKYAGHYIGLTNNVAKRLGTHAAGNGNGLVKAAMARGKVVVVRLWEQDGHFERKLKRRKNARRLCPICRQADGLKPNAKLYQK
jgi:predicted GIY-YIG superfamily endonuclease